MARGAYLGEFELMVLLALIRLGDDAYGVTISREIEKRSGREVAIGSVYAALERLEEKGFVASRLGDPTAERGGRAKRYFRITSQGLRGVRESQRALINLWNGLPATRRRQSMTTRRPPAIAAWIVDRLSSPPPTPPSPAICWRSSRTAARRRWYWRQTVGAILASRGRLAIPVLLQTLGLIAAYAARIPRRLCSVAAARFCRPLRPVGNRARVDRPHRTRRSCRST